MDRASKAPQTAHSSNRLLEALSTLAGLVDRVINEVKSLDGAPQASSESQTGEHVERARQQLLDELTRRFQDEFQIGMESVKMEFGAERDALNNELDRAVDATAKFETERSRLITELQRVQAEGDLEKTRAEAAASTSKSPEPTSASTAAVAEEIAAVEAKLQEINTLIDDPGTEFSTVIKRNIEKSELHAYLKGIRFAINPDGPDSGGAEE